jgi:hypothetical protein
MSTTKYTDLLDEVMPELPGAQTALVTNQIRNAVIAFCGGSDIWRAWLDPIDVVAAQNTYDVTVDAGTDLVRLLSLKFDGFLLTPRSEDALDAWRPRWRTEERRPEHYMQQDQDTVTLACVPPCSLAGGLLLSVSMQPDRNSKGFPGWIYSQYWEGITAGAKARMMLMPGKPWSNPKQAILYAQMFENETAAARADASKSLVRSRSVSRSTH